MHNKLVDSSLLVQVYIHSSINARIENHHTEKKHAKYVHALRVFIQEIIK